MKIYNITRWMKIPVTVMVMGEKEKEKVQQMTPKEFSDYFYEHTERDEREGYWEGTDYEQVGEQEVEFVDEDDEEEPV